MTRPAILLAAVLVCGSVHLTESHPVPELVGVYVWANPDDSLHVTVTLLADGTAEELVARPKGTADDWVYTGTWDRVDEDVRVTLRHTEDRPQSARSQHTYIFEIERAALVDRRRLPSGHVGEGHEARYVRVRP